MTSPAVAWVAPPCDGPGRQRGQGQAEAGEAEQRDDQQVPHAGQPPERLARSPAHRRRRAHGPDAPRRSRRPSRSSSGSGLGDAHLHVGLDVGERVRRGEPGRVQPVVVQVPPAGDGDDRHAGRAAAAAATPAGALPCRVCSSSRPSPVMTRPAPARCSGSRPGRARRRCRGSRSRLQHTQRREADAARGARARDARRAGVDARRPAGPAPRRAARRHPVTRPSAGRRRAAAPRAPSSGLSTSLARPNSTAGQPPVEAGQVDRRQVGQGAAAERELPPGRVEEPRAQGLQHPGAAVGARAAADAEDDLRQPWSRAARTSSPVPKLLAVNGFSSSVGQQDQPGREGQLDHRDLVADGDRGVDRVADRAR